MTSGRSDGGETALVLGSGGARAAYEVGVARFIFEDLHAEMGRVPRVDLLCGSSAGALHALALAAFADRPLAGVGFVARRWNQLELPGLFRARPLVLEGQGGILDPRPFRRLVFEGVPVESIGGHIGAGRLSGVSVTATEVATGRATLFVQSRGRALGLSANRAWRVLETTLGAEHAFASSAIPLLFPPVRIKGRSYCDGSLRQSVPFSPALHLGAHRVLAVSTQHCPPSVPSRLEQEREQAVTSPLYLLGKAVNALTMDRVDDDLERLALVNQVLEAGTRAFGPDFLARLNLALEAGAGRVVHPVQAVLVRPSESLGRVAADHVRGRRFHARVGGAVGRLFARLAEGESPHEADLLSYLLFDGAFAATLMDMGYGDARHQREDLLALFAADERAQPRAA
jgi:NTE family protein